MSSYIPAIAGVLAFLVTTLSGLFIIPWLRKLKFGQIILDIGPAWHKNKQGTPTMGGMMFALGTIVAIIVALVTDYFTNSGVFFGSTEALKVQNAKIFAGLFLALGLGIVGFLDDYTKIAKKRNLGLTAKQKSLGQLVVVVVYLESFIALVQPQCISRSLADLTLQTLPWQSFSGLWVYSSFTAQ